MPERIPGADRNLSPILALIGAALIVVGAIAAFMGPVEVYCFYLFETGGRLAYDGFGFGSLLFGIIAWQIAGYYVIALLCIPLGAAHVRPRRWARVLMLSLLWCALILGLPLLMVFLVMLSFKELSGAGAVLLVVVLAALSLVGPALLIRFYSGESARRTFEARDPTPHPIEHLPLPVLVLTTLLFFYCLVLHVPLFYHGLVPLFGTWLSGLPGFVALALAVWSLAGVTWGVVRQRVWAWWAALVYFAALLASSAVTLVRSSLADMLAPMRLPPADLDILAGVPLQGVHLLPFVALPLALTLVVILISRQHFDGRVPAAEPVTYPL